jgi:hypothetical protein
MRLITSICLGLGAAILLLAVYLGLELVNGQKTMVREAQEAAHRQAEDAAGAIDSELTRQANIADQLAEQMSSGGLTGESSSRRLMEIMEAGPDLYGLGIAYAPFSFGPQQRLYAPSCFRREGERSPQLLAYEDELDYTNPEIEWYANAMEGRSGWAEPLWHEAGGFITAVYSTPFSRADGNREVAGVVFLLMKMTGIEQQMARLELGHSGYATVISREAYFLVHPSPVSVQEHVNLFQLPEVASDQAAQQALANATQGGSGMLDRENRLTGQASFFFYEPIPGPGWSLFVTLIKDEIPRDQRQFRRQVIHTSVSVIVGLTGLMVWPFVGLYRKYSRVSILWCLVGFSSLLILAGLVIIRYVVFNQASEDDRDSVSVVDSSGLDAFVQSQRIQAGKSEPPALVPTGIFLQSMKFTGPDEILITGYVWQKYAEDLPQKISRGFTFPDAISPHITEAYHRREDNLETIGWYFETRLRQNMNVSRYPFDHSDVSIRLWHKELGSGVFLVPDLASYSLRNPAGRPGIDESLSVSGWTISASFFDYKFVEYQTDLGIPGQFEVGRRPELNFNVRLKRLLLDAMISNGIPLGVVLVMLFAILVTSTTDEEESKLLGFNPSGVLRTGSALFFVVLLAHIQLRSRLDVDEVVFMESFYFLVYLTILAVSLHSFLFSLARFNRGPLGYHHGLVQKLLFWPLLLSASLVVTILRFY